MRARLAGLATTLALSLCAALPAAAANLDFELVNQSGYVMRELYLSPESSNRWGDDVLGRDTLDTGMSTSIVFPEEADNCIYDIRMIFSDNDEVTDTIDLCEIGVYTVN